jgi:hypothetical protein
MQKLFDFFDDLKWKILTWFHRKEYKKNLNLAMLNALGMESILKDQQETKILPEFSHPLHSQRVKEVKELIEDITVGSLVDLNIGDSLTHLAEKHFRDIEIFAPLSGSWSFHILEMFKAILLFIKKKKLLVETVYVGTALGNPMLSYENFDESVKDCLNLLTEIRKSLPDTRIVYYGLPPAYNLNIVRNTFDAEAKIYRWIFEDDNAVLISLKKFGKGFLGLFPTIEFSSDGVHLTDMGADRLAESFYKAKLVKPDSIILA